MTSAPIAAVVSGEASSSLGVLTRWRGAVISLCVAFILVMGWRQRDPISLARPDEFIYLALSQSLETGSYREIYLADAPLHVKYPPGYPAWITLVRTVAGENPDVIRGANLALLAAFTLCLYGIVRHVAGVPVALAAILLVALNATLLEIGGTLLSEPLFTALIGASLLCTVRASPEKGGYVAGAIVFALLAFLTRTAGIAVLLALLPWLWQRRRPREVIAYFAASLVAVGGWFAYTSSIPEGLSGRSYGVDIATGLGTSSPGLIARILGRFWAKWTGYLTEGLPWSLGLPTVPGTVADNLAWIVVMVVLILAGVLVFWRKSRAVAVYVALAAMLIAIWPWRVDRLLVPVLPFVIAAMLVGMQSLITRLAPGWRTPLLAGLVLLMGFGSARIALARDATMSACDRTNPYGSPGCYSRAARKLVTASEYLRAHTSPEATVLTLYSPEIYHLSGRRTAPVQMIYGAGEGEAARILRERNVEYVLISDMDEQRKLSATLLRSCRELRVEASLADSVLVLSAHPPRVAAEDTCPILTRLAAAKRPRADQ